MNNDIMRHAIQKPVDLNELPEYICHKKIRAAKIDRIAYNEKTDQYWIFVSVDGHPLGHVEIDIETYNKRGFQVGGFVTVYNDGYISYSPEEPFLDGYKRLIQE